ncbi:MAG: TatD family hydrolase [Rhodobacteraceae bacterium]|nr:TatD family hydrolase [Paracoccaceae bacterium]
MAFLVDSHCHLDFPDFAPEQEAVVARAKAAGVGHMLTIGTHVTKFDQVRAVAEKYDGISCTVGIHPHEAASEPPVDVERLIELAHHPKVVAFGETGLDFYYEHSPRREQETNFRVHIAAARQANLPVVIHTRDADSEMGAILQEEMEQGTFTGVIHCFSSGPELAELAIKLGLYISLSGIVTFKKAEALREVAKTVPMDRLLVETDAPYLAPVPFRGKRNEPAYVAHTAATVAGLKGVGSAELAARTTDNFFRLFTKAERPAA